MAATKPIKSQARSLSVKRWWAEHRPLVHQRQEQILSLSVDRGAPDDCWPWNGKHGGNVSDDGYPNIKWRGKTTNAHRIIWEQIHGPIVEPGIHVDHLCRNRLCCNPSHLEAVPMAENVRRGNAYSAVNARKTHCPQGHPYNGPNLSFSSHADGRKFRMCRACSNTRNKERRDREREARGLPPRQMMSPAQVDEAVRRINAGERHSDIALAFGVKRTVISCMAHRLRSQGVDVAVRLNKSNQWIAARKARERLANVAPLLAEEVSA